MPVPMHYETRNRFDAKQFMMIVQVQKTQKRHKPNVREDTTAHLQICKLTRKPDGYLLEDLTSKTSTSRSYAGKLFLLLPDARLALLLLPLEEANPSPLSLRLPGCSITSTISSSCLSSRTSWSSERCLIRALTSPQTVSESAYLEHITQQYWPSGPSR